MDIFNKKKIATLEKWHKADMDRIQNELAEKDKKIKELENRYRVGSYVDDENDLVLILVKYIRAITDFLDIKVEWHWEDDEAYPTPQRRQKKVWRAEKINHIKLKKNWAKGLNKVKVNVKSTPIKDEWEKEFEEMKWADENAMIDCDTFKGLKDFIHQLIIKEYKKGYNDCLKENKIPNDMGSKSL